MRGRRILERCDRRCRGQQLAQHDRSRHSDASPTQVELRDAVLAQRGERDPAELGHRGVLQHHLGQMAGGVARDVVEANAVCHRGRRCQRGAWWADTECLLSCQWALTEGWGYGYRVRARARARARASV